jgi:hypothetical protein
LNEIRSAANVSQNITRCTGTGHGRLEVGIEIGRKILFERFCPAFYGDGNKKSGDEVFILILALRMLNSISVAVATGNQ